METFALPPNVAIARGRGDASPVVDLDLASGRAEDARPLAVVDREVVDLVLDEPAVAVPADGRPDDVRGSLRTHVPSVVFDDL